ncbi:MAG: nucleotide sugar dehydrogenase [Candidatus Aenigmatarchaeota archaeon]
MTDISSINSEKFSISVIGLGRIGIPISLAFSQKGIKVYGFDNDEKWIEELSKGNLFLFEKGFENIYRKVLNKTFIPLKFSRENFHYIENSLYILITVGIHINNNGKVEKDILFSLIDNIVQYIKNKTIILRTTVPIGFTRELKNYIEEKYKLKEGKDFYLTFVPERLVEGNGIEEEEKLPKIIGGFSNEGIERTKQLFNIFNSKILVASSPETAEFIKLIDNSFRNLLFNFSNELALLANRLNIDIVEAISLAKTDYQRNSMLAFPGPVSGYCLSKDPLILDLNFKEVFGKDYNSLNFFARKINDKYLDEIIKIIKNKKYKKIAVLGLSFKKDVDDFRYSHSLELIKKLLNEINEIDKVLIHDIFLNKNRYTNYNLFFSQFSNKVKSLEKLEELEKENVDVIILSTPHSFYIENYNKLDIDCLIIDLYYAFYGIRNKFKRAKVIFI